MTGNWGKRLAWFVLSSTFNSWYLLFLISVSVKRCIHCLLWGHVSVLSHFPTTSGDSWKLMAPRKEKSGRKSLVNVKKASVDRNIAFMTDLYHLGVDVASFMAPGRQRTESEVWGLNVLIPADRRLNRGQKLEKRVKREIKKHWWLWLRAGNDSPINNS